MMNDKPAQILYSSMSGQMTGGGQQSLLLLLKNLDLSRFRPHLLCPDEGELTSVAGSLGIEIILLDTPRLIKFDLSTIRRIIAIIASHRVEIIHADHPRQVFYLGIAARFTGTPLIWHVRVGNRGNFFFERILHCLASKIIAVSDAAASRFGKQYHIDKKISVIYNAVDLAAFSPVVQGTAVRREFGCGDKIIIGTVGQLLPGKGQELFIQAAAEINKTHKGEVVFMIVGTGTPEYTAYLKERVSRLQMENAIVFTGYRNDMPELMAAFDVVALATMYIEGLSRVLIEAMAAGKPVITTRLGGNSETVKDGTTGILIPPGNAAVLAKAMVTLIDDETLRAKMGESGRQFALDRFDIKRNVKAIETMYDQLLAGKKLSN